MLYIPNYNTNNCVVVTNYETVRVYQSKPTNNSTVNYRDYFIRSHYIYNTGVATFSNYSTLPTCLNSNEITTNFYYRHDFDSIMIIFMSIVLLCYFLAFKPIVRLFGRWLRL